ncbi:MAG: aldehyde dehydrogenase family protein [Phycisphaerales bacterium]
MQPKDFFPKLGLTESMSGLAYDGKTHNAGGKPFDVHSPIDGRKLGSVTLATPADTEKAIDSAAEAFKKWRTVPAPVRGELVRRFGVKLREHKQTLGALVAWEVGKITAEAEGEVQEMIDICDFAVGLSRQLYGLTIASERYEHRLTEQWHPLGPIGVISAFNFPVAVWAWNAALALVCGNTLVWKPSEKAPFCALACQNLLNEVIAETEGVPAGISAVVIGLRDTGESISNSHKLPLVSATGSIPMGKAVGKAVGARLGRALLELGGNNAMVLTPTANLDLALPAITFAAVGTCGQRCTSLRRLIAHKSVKDTIVQRLVKVYEQIKIGDPTQPGTLIGPLIDKAAADAMDATIKKAQAQGGKLITGGGRTSGGGVPNGGVYVKPAIIEIAHDAEVVQTETFAPILYVITYDKFEDAVAIHNNVPQGLSSAVFTDNVREAELFCGPAGSDCGIANVNIGTSGAEIGGAFGGEKETGGGRESGSDAWKAYMRRSTQTVNYSTALPLAQGIKFDV